MLTLIQITVSIFAYRTKADAVICQVWNIDLPFQLVLWTLLIILQLCRLQCNIQ